MLPRFAYKKLLMLLCLAQPSFICAHYKTHRDLKQREKLQKLAIKANPASGFFSCFIGVVNNLLWCDEKNVAPAVFWSKNDSLYYEEGAHNGNPNVWEYYFEPVSAERYKKGDIVSDYSAPDGGSLDIYEELCPAVFQDRELWRKRHKIVSKYIRVRPYILEKTDNFYNQKMQGKVTIGIHIRGTDKFTEVHPISFVEFFQKVNLKAKEFPGCQFLVATDELRILEIAKRMLDGEVIFYDSYRSKDGKPLHQPKVLTLAHGLDLNVIRSKVEYSKALLGEEVLIEVLLLSRCNFLFHTCSTIPAGVLQFNPEIEHELVMSREKSESTKQRLDKNYSIDWDKFLRELEEKEKRRNLTEEESPRFCIRDG